MYDLVIIGGGPAGYTAGMYASRARLKVLLLSSIFIQSQTTTTAEVENYPGFPDSIGGFELLERMKQHAVKFGLEVLDEQAESIDQEMQDGKQIWKIKIGDKVLESLSLIAATGAIPRELGIPGESKFKGRGVSYCAVCDAALFKGKDIVVVGGGDTAIEEALFLAKFVKSIKIIHRRDRLRATKILQEKVVAEQKINFVWNSNAEEITGEQKIEGVKIKNKMSGENSFVACDGVFIFAGYLPNTDLFKRIVELNEEGYIIADDNMHTSQKGIFACGDCRKKLLRQVVTACGDGATAAFSAQQYVESLCGTEYK